MTLDEIARLDDEGFGRAGIADRWLRSHERTYEQIVMVERVALLHGRPGVAVVIALRLNESLWYRLEEVSCYLLESEALAWHQAHGLADELALSLWSRDAAGQWRALWDPDTDTRVEPGSVTLFGN